MVRAELIASALASRLASRRLAALVRFDGLYDVFSSDEAVDVVRKRLVENAGDPVRAATSLCSTAVDDCGSRDNGRPWWSRCGRRSRREYRE